MPQDFWFTFDTAQTLTVRTYQLDGWFSDPMLWLYDSDGRLLASNDDWYGLQSNIVFQVQSGSYRVRAGWCCGNPDAVRQGWRYSFGSSADPVSTTTSTVQVTTTVQETTTTEPATTSTTMLETTTTSSTTTTIPYVAPTTTDPAPTTSVQPTTTQPATTQPESTTTTDASTTTIPVSTTTQPEAVAETIQTTTTQEPSTTIPPVKTMTTSSQPPALRPLATVPPQNPTTTVTTTPDTTTSSSQPETTTTVLEPSQPEPALTADAVTAAIDQADTPTERAALVTKLNTADNATKKTFEATVNVYDGKWDSYVPAGSRIPVGERRTLIAVMGGLVSLASTAPRRKK